MRDTLHIIIRFVVLVLLQVLILNNIHFWGLVCPFIYILFVLTLPTAMPTTRAMLLAFILGFTIDIFACSYGIHAAASVLVAYLRPYIMKLTITRENMEKSEPSQRHFGPSFYLYAAILIWIHHFTLFLFEAFAWSHLPMILLKTLCSSAATMLLIVCAQLVNSQKR